MTPACAELQVFVSLRAAGALDAAEEAVLEAHLAACPACRAEAARDAEVLAVARLPAPTERERRALADVPARAVATVRRREARRGLAKRIAAVAGVVAAALLMVTAPALLGRPPAPPEAAAPVAAASWDEPDLDAIWSDTDVLELEPATGGSGAESAALAALDAG